jgi:hypothetical protein
MEDSKTKSVKKLLSEVNDSINKFYPDGITFCCPSPNPTNPKNQKCVSCGSTACELILFDKSLTKVKNFSTDYTFYKPGIFVCGFDRCFYKVKYFLELFVGLYEQKVCIVTSDKIIEKGWTIIGPVNENNSEDNKHSEDSIKILVTKGAIKKHISICDLYSWQVEKDIFELIKNVAYLSVLIDGALNRDTLKHIVKELSATNRISRDNLVLWNKYVEVMDVPESEKRQQKLITSTFSHLIKLLE